MIDILRSTIAVAEISGPHAGEGEEVFRSQSGFDIILREHDGFPLPELRSANGEPIRVLEDDGGAPLDEEEVSRILWERLEEFDAVIDRLAGPLPDL